MSGLVAVVLNQILPQEDPVVEDDEDVPHAVEVIDVEARSNVLDSEKK